MSASKRSKRVVIRRNKYTKKYEVWLVSGCQSFQFKYEASYAHCVWFREMLRRADVFKKSVVLKGMS